MENLHSLKQFDSLKTYTTDNGSKTLISDGEIPKKTIVKMAKDISKGDIIYDSNPAYSARMHLVTSIESAPIEYTITDKTATGTSGSTIITINDVTDVVKNMTISGSGIQDGTIISSVNNDNGQVTLSLKTTSALNNTSIVLNGEVDVYLFYYLDDSAGEVQYTYNSDYLDSQISNENYY